MRRRLVLRLRGAVQGVGFRPFVYRLATELSLGGHVRNTSDGVDIDVEGEPDDVERFVTRLESERPTAAVVLGHAAQREAPVGRRSFEILPSEPSLAPTAAVLPDLATCPDCLSEIFDPANRRYRYPFTNCTACGPRQTIQLDIPYDRARTTMQGFALCRDCEREFRDVADRRFEAQPVACPRCGPALAGTVEAAARQLRAGRIVALKGIGGYQLLVDAGNAEAVERLRLRKGRGRKPFAVMMPSLDTVRACCRVSDAEARVLLSAAAPIVLLEPLPGSPIAPEVSSDSPWVGVMLPYSPLHHLLTRAFGLPVVATSGNRSEEPIAIDNEEAERRLGGIADSFLHHNRPIARPVDDSVVRVSETGPAILRRARGYAPLPVETGTELRSVLAAGGHLKSTVAIARGSQVFLSPHLGDLDSPESRAAFQRAIDDLLRLYRFEPELVACDLHPDYASTRWGRACGLPVVEVQHHHAHLASCAADNRVQGPYLGVAWDGSGYGLDGTVWGGEFFTWDGSRFTRVAHLRPFHLPGGEAAVKQGWRVAVALSDQVGQASACRLTGVLQIQKMIQSGVNSPISTSVGRVFDAVASLAGLGDENAFEGQAAMRLEAAIEATGECYQLSSGDWRAMIEAVLDDSRKGVAAGRIAARFHNALAAWIVEEAERAALLQVVLSGGVFQNRYLTRRAEAMLEARGFRVHTHRQVPANDGGIALGQAVLAGRRMPG